MREEGGITVIEDACQKLSRQIDRHLKVYGASNDQRLTGEHETCSINDFRYGISDRGASIRIPIQTAQDGMGYLEDRRPAANADPYRVAEALVRTICED
jgi:glutamine synthetase